MQACLRAVRADYCGCGTSQTTAKAWIQLGDRSYNWPCDAELPGACLEAGWNATGAVCMGHERLAKFSALLLARLDVSEKQFKKNWKKGAYKPNKMMTAAAAATRCEAECKTEIDSILAGQGPIVANGPQRQCVTGDDKVTTDALLYNRSWHYNASDPDDYTLCDLTNLVDFEILCK